MAFDWSICKSDLTWLPERTIYITVHGSRAYGTSLPTSDTDIRGVCIAPKAYYLGFLNRFEQVEQKPPLPDLTVFDIRKFLKLACDVNPNVIELLYTEPSDHLLLTPAWERIVAVRDSFLSKRVKHTFSGYALSQLKRINLHYRWLKNPPPGPPTRAEFGLPQRTVIPADQLAAAQSQIRKKLDAGAWQEMDDLDEGLRQAIKDEFVQKLSEITMWTEGEMEGKTWRAVAGGLGYDTNFIELLDMERRYGTRQKDWESYLNWKKTRNPDRAKLEEQFGYDTKHALHLVRLLRMCREILTEGVVRVRRPDAQELLTIRAGAWDYHKLIEWAAQEDRELTEIAQTSKLPQQPDRRKIDELCWQLVESSF